MAQLQRAAAVLRIIGKDLAPEKVSVLLGADPSRSEIVDGEMTPASGWKKRVRSGHWRFAASETEPANLDAQVAEILGQLTKDLGIWRELSKRFDVDLFCGWFMGAENEGVSISAETLIALGERGIELSLDIYGPDPV